MWISDRQEAMDCGHDEEARESMKRQCPSERIMPPGGQALNCGGAGDPDEEHAQRKKESEGPNGGERLLLGTHGSGCRDHDGDGACQSREKCSSESEEGAKDDTHGQSPAFR